ncbi:MAG TPA: bacillithiol system redox-active protein YtxJ [Flavobacteriaceae bacterium]|nr:bacillithiol system redox-active protein YtxJ [Flavobacteriaceae bacterium]
MSFFSKFKSARDIAKEAIVEIPWHIISDERMLDEIIEESEKVPVLIFKHSTRCGISRAVLKIFERNYKLNEDQLKLYFLDLLQYRDISNRIASRFGVQHESPQILIIKGGKSIYDTSHHSIDADEVAKIVG